MVHVLPFSGEDLNLLMGPLTERDVKQILERFYRSVPATQCLNCGECCQLTKVERRSGWVTMFPLYAIEYLYMVQYIREHLPKAEQECCFGFQEEWPLQCPFRDPQQQRCRIYPARPFTCRAYGVLDRTCIAEAVQRHAEDVSVEGLRLFRMYEEHLCCSNVHVTEPLKLKDYITHKVSFRYTRGLEWLSWRVDLLSPEKNRILQEVTGQERIVKWTWGGFNTLYFSSEEGFEDHLRTYWEQVKLIT